MKTKKNILVCPLNWGLGHASRCVPLIETLQQQGFCVILACSGRAGAFLKQRFPGLLYIDFPDYKVRIPRSGRLIGRLLLNLPVYLLRVRKEHRRLQSLVKTYQIEVVISDNRYGLYSNHAHCIFITHQLMLKCPSWLRFAEAIGHRIILHYVNKYNECWIPDGVGEADLSGDLSHQYPLPGNACWVGHMSRFATADKNISIPSAPAYDLLAVISGPEPQRNHFEKIMLKCFNNLGKHCCIIRGVPDQSAPFTDGNTDLLPHAEDAYFAALLRNAGLIICRPGYSTLMDLMILGKKALLVPTPGQTEQEYLARRMKKSDCFLMATQQELESTGLPDIPNEWFHAATSGISVQPFHIPPSSRLSRSS